MCVISHLARRTALGCLHASANMRGPMIFCLVAVSAVTAQNAEPQSVPLNAPLIPFDQLNAMTVEQRTAYANTFNHPSEALDSKGASSYKSETRVSAPGYAGVTGYKEPGYASLGWNGQPASVSRDSGYESQYRNDGYKSERSEKWREGKDEVSKEWNRSENTRNQKGPYAYGYDDGHKSSRGYSDSLPKDYPFQIIGLHGLVFEKRYSRASGLMNPITPESLAHLGYRQKKKDEVFVPPY